ncbi:MAG: beta-lactamase family protein [Schleiferiaceae bacterium]|jgi:D-alanyl-D-alanine carboxypeptidase|nr:beta-lactamase family protein [Schleiferiaceae bacterium]
MINSKPLFTIVILLNSVLGFGQSIENKFQKLLDSTLAANPKAVGMQIHVEAPDWGISWTGAAGVSDTISKEIYQLHQPSLVASNTKTFVAATILKLIEQGRFKLDQPIDKLISEKSKKALLADQYDLSKITIRHLLTHTSGIADYVNDAYFEFVQNHPKYKWSAEQQVNRAVTHGSPLAEPGEAFSYADINYVLLAEIIKIQYGKAYYTAMRELIDFEELGLSHTWTVKLENSPPKTLPLAHQYAGSFNMDSYDFDPSWDLYGGGGLASNAKDLAIFFQALFNGQVVKDEDLLREMYTYVLDPETSRYCLGIWNIDFYQKTKGYVHGGFWGTASMYLPEHNATISSIVLQRDLRDLNHQLSNQLLEIIEELEQE